MSRVSLPLPLLLLHQRARHQQSRHPDFAAERRTRDEEERGKSKAEAKERARAEKELAEARCEAARLPKGNGGPFFTEKSLDAVLFVRMEPFCGERQRHARYATSLSTDSLFSLSVAPHLQTKGKGGALVRSPFQGGGRQGRCSECGSSRGGRRRRRGGRGVFRRRLCRCCRNCRRHGCHCL